MLPQHTTPDAPLAPLGPDGIRRAVMHAARMRRPLFIWGEPGIGKSQSVYQAADALYAEAWGWTLDEWGILRDPDGAVVRGTEPRPWVTDLRAVYMDPSTVTGLPSVDQETHTTHWNPVARMPRKGPGIIFLDEPNRAPALVMNALMELTQDRRMGEYEVPATIAVIAAGNRVADGGGVTKLNSALSSRFMHVDAEANVNDFLAWGMANGLHPTTLAYHKFREQHAPKDANGQRAADIPPDVFCHFDRNARAWPNPRSWQIVSELMYEFDAHPDPAIELPMLIGTVGQGTAIDYLAFVSMFRVLPDMDQVRANPTTAPVPTEPGVQWAIASNLGSTMTERNIGNCLVYLDRMHAEYAVFAVRYAIRRDPCLAQTRAFTQWALTHQEVLQ